MDPASYTLKDVRRALERRGIDPLEWVHYEGTLYDKKLNELLDLLRTTIRSEKARRGRLDALPLSYHRRHALPYEIIAHIQTFLGPLALPTHVALSQLNRSVRAYLFGSTNELIEKRWRQICLRSGMGIIYKDLTEPDPVKTTWENSALRTVEWRFLHYHRLPCSWTQMETSSRWEDWTDALLALSGSELHVLSSEEVEEDELQLQINPALSYMRLMDMNDLEFAIQDLQYHQWLSVYDNRSCVDMLLTFPPVSELTVIIEDVAGNYEKLKLSNKDGVVIWDLWRRWYDKLWFPIEGILLSQFVEGERGDYSASIPSNYDGELYDLDEDEDEDEEDAANGADREAVLEEIVEEYGGDYGLMFGRVVFGERGFYGDFVEPDSGSTQFELLLEDPLA